MQYYGKNVFGEFKELDLKNGWFKY